MTPIKIQTLGNTTITINADQICVVKVSVREDRATEIIMSNNNSILTSESIDSILEKAEKAKKS